MKLNSASLILVSYNSEICSQSLKTSKDRGISTSRPKPGREVEFSHYLVSSTTPLTQFVLDGAFSTPKTQSKVHPTSTMRSPFSTSLFRQAASRRASPSFAARRFTSTSQTSNGASSSKQVQDALSAAQRLLASAGRVLGPFGERAAGLLGCAYYSVLSSHGG